MKTLLLTNTFIICLIILVTRAAGQSYVPAKPYGEPKLVNDFICSEITYPEAALEQGLEGTVVLRFVVSEAGSVSDIRVKEGVSPELDREAVRVFRLLQWEPAIRLGNPVPSEEEFPFKFNIKKYHRHCKQMGATKMEQPYSPADTSLQVYGPAQLSSMPEPIFEDPLMTLPRFITSSLVYPEAAYKQNISGEVELSFVIETNGRPSNIIIVRPLGGGCTEEAIRIFKQIMWMPGIKDGLAVRSRINLSVAFKLPNESDMKMFDNNQGGF